MLSTLAVALSVLAAEPIPVFVTIEEEESHGFVNPEGEEIDKEKSDTAEDLTKRLRKKKALRVVDRAEEAVVVVTVVGRGRIPTGTVVTRAEWGGGLKTTENTVETVYAILSVKNYSLDLFGQNDGRWVGAWGPQPASSLGRSRTG